MKFITPSSLTFIFLRIDNTLAIWTIVIIFIVPTTNLIRPILIGEALMSVSLAPACIKEAVQKKAMRLLETSQFAIGMPAGAEAMVWQAKVFRHK